MFYGDMRIYYIRHMRHSTSTHINLIFDSSRELERFNDSSTSTHTHTVLLPNHQYKHVDKKNRKFSDSLTLFIYLFIISHATISATIYSRCMLENRTCVIKPSNVAFIMEKYTCQTFFGLILWLFGSFCFNGRLFAYSIGYGLWKLLCQSDYTN